MHKFLILVTENDENGNKRTDVEPQYFYLDDEMKVRETYKKYRNQYRTQVVDEPSKDADVKDIAVQKIVTTGIKKYTVEICKGIYKQLSKADADAWVDSLIQNA